MAADDRLLVDRIKAGEADCFSELLSRYGSRVYSTIVRVVGNHEDAQEVTQDVFLKVYSAIGSWRGDSSLSTWIFRIAYNKAISHLRSVKHNRVFADGDLVARCGAEDEATEKTADRERMLSLLEQAITQLPADESMLVTMFYHQDKSVEELSQITGLSPSNVKVKLHRARKKLQICMERTNIQ